MPVEPRLLNPTKVTFAQKNVAKTQYDDLRRTPINVVAKDAQFDIDAQVKWDILLGDFANPQPMQTGLDERELGYLIVRFKDVEALGKTIKRGDRIVKIGEGASAQTVNFYVLRLDYGSHYGGKFKLMKVVFGDRTGQDG